MVYITSFLLLLGPLVFVHELGHYLFAKLFKVRVDTFSIGFGPKIFSKTWGETEYCLSVIPLGGYVKLYGQDPNEEVTTELQHRSLLFLKPWKRFLVLFGGPLFNFLFAVFVFATMMVLGEPHIAPKVARVLPQSAAEKMGFQRGDLVTTIDKTVVSSFEEVQKIISEAPGKELSVRVRGVDSAIRELKVVPEAVPGFTLYGEPTDIGDVPGLQIYARGPVIGISDAGSAAYLAGLRSGDWVYSINDRVVQSFEELEFIAKELFSSASAGKPLRLAFGVVRDPEFEKGNYQSALKAKQPTQVVVVEGKVAQTVAQNNPVLSPLGIYSSELFVAKAVDGLPAFQAGVQTNDRVVGVRAAPGAALVELSSFDDLKWKVNAFGQDHKSFVLVVERATADGMERLEKTLQPQVQTQPGPTGKEVTSYMIGLAPRLIQTEPEYVIERTFNPWTLTVVSWTKAIDLSAKTFISIKKLVTRKVSVGTLGGPLLIGKLAGDSMSRGLNAFLRVMALISISLAVFNLLPVPVLDGGHIFLLGIEVIRRKPISVKQTELIQQVGLSLIVLLLVVVLFNDITRVGLPALKNFFH